MYVHNSGGDFSILYKDFCFSIVHLKPKIQQTKMLVTCQRFGDLFLVGLVWQYFSLQTKYNKGRFKVMATYLQLTCNFDTLALL